MKNHRIEPHRIEGLVTTTAKAFAVIKEGTEGDPRHYAKHMHFMADLLKDLVDTAYPIEDKEIDTRNLIEIAQFQSFEEMMNAVAKIAKATKPPKAGKF
ncbi:hypothetical protein [Tissierella pigra]|uniref:Uncharacterized protein n=1 Tax=Tissierella pigra TaxID=2607614 RepID=A0A6N7XVJ6_9FIRM|nr:hypothetical protein [Tissierella pigra]MSU01807.1 hypothetical protein [Tissierella pigra]